ncbi:MAG TPA: SLC13 family permease [Rhizobiales bacterium]|nr:SLC13 family permease [Hyphomicrobiales bacterium]
MTTDQIILFSLLFFVFAFLIWGRIRYDLVAFIALIIAIASGVVPKEQAFSGFGHPATIIIALVLIISRGLSNSGAVELIGHHVASLAKSLPGHIAAMAGISAVLSAIMNNVAALALLMPVDLQAAARARRSPALTLMPLSFASILGGMVTMIGTPPNIIIAEFRGKLPGQAAFTMFDFTPVGVVCATIGVIFIATIGWRLIPAERKAHDSRKELMDIEDYIAELHVPESSPVIGQKVRELDDIAEDKGITVIGLVRRGKRLPGQARREEIRKGDTLVVEARPEAIDGFAGALKLDYRRNEKASRITAKDVSLLEVAVPAGARIEGRTALSMRLQYRHGVTLLGISRQGRSFREQVRKLPIKAGDILLLLGPAERLAEIATGFGGLPLAERGLQLIQRDKALLASGLFAFAIALASFGLIYLPVALAGVVALFALLKIVPVQQIYRSVEWPVIVLLGSMIPIGGALESSGGTALIAQNIVALSQGYSAIVVLTLLMVVTMTLSDVMNNTATAVISAPIAVDIANRLNVNPDPFLMTVAVAASCAFLTPIGHKNNTLIMGPGGYRFGDYWRMGLPLEILIIAVSIPAILLFWPL